MKLIFLAIIISFASLGARGMDACIFKRQLMSTDKLVTASTVKHILEDSEGYIWYATEGGGICRDNGREMLLFRSDASHPDLLGSNNVNCLAEVPGKAGRYGQILIGTYHGAYILDKNDYSISRIPDVDDKRVDDICMASNGHYWITANKKLYEFDSDGRLASVHPSVWQGDSLYVSDIMEDSHGQIWATQWEGGLLVWNPKDARFVEAEWPYDVSPTSMVEDTLNECFWIGTVGKGVVRYQPAAMGKHAGEDCCGNMIGAEYPLSSQICINLLMDVSGEHLWVITMNDIALLKIEGGHIRHLPVSWDREVGNMQELNRLSMDSRGNVLVAGGEKSSFAILRSTEELKPLDCLYRQGYSWEYQDRVGIVCTLRDDTRRSVLQYEGRMLLPYMAMSRHHNGVWATDGKNLLLCALVDGDSLAVSRKAELLSRPMALADDGAGYIWMASSAGLSRVSLTTGATELLVPGIEDISAIALAPDGTWWLASIFGQVYVYDGEGIRLDEEASLKHGDAITHLSVDSGGNLWMQTSQYIRAYHPETRMQQMISRESEEEYSIHLKSKQPQMRWSEPPVAGNEYSWLFSWWMWAVYLFLVLAVVWLAIHNLILRKQRRKFLADMVKQVVVKDEPEEHVADEEMPMEETVYKLTEADRRWLQKVMDLVGENLSNEAYSVEQLSSDMCVSRMTFYRKLQHLTGQKPSEFIRTIRLQHAAVMLKEGKLTVTEVSYATGFSSASYFSRCFRTMFGVPPTQFGKNMMTASLKSSGSLTSEAGMVRKNTPDKE